MDDYGWVKIHRSVLNWEWFKYDGTFKVFLYLILKASTEDKEWKGLKITRGQLVTSVKKIAVANQQTNQQTKTHLKRLKSTNEITIKTTNKFSIITICNYERYQVGISPNQQTNQQTDQQANQQTKGKQKENKTTTSKEYKEYIYNNINIINKTNIDIRSKKFLDELKKYSDVYSSEMLVKFGDYWTEPSRNGKVMRFEKEKTWDLERRLRYWAQRDKEYRKSKSTVKSNHDIDNLLSVM